MKKIRDMSRNELCALLQTLVAEPIFASRERLLVLLKEPSSAKNRERLGTEFREFFCGYENLALWLETYEEDPLDGLEPHTVLAKRLKRHRDYILANRTTTLEERMVRRMGSYLKSDSMPQKKIAELRQGEYQALLHGLVNQELFVVQRRVVMLLQENARCEKLSAAFREFFVAYELLELALEEYHYDPDEGLELRTEVAERLNQSVAEVEAGTAELIPLEEVAKKFGIPLKCTG